MKPFSWTIPKPPGDGCHYDNTKATTPFGDYVITWKSWKDHGDYCIEFNGEFLTVANDLPDAKDAAQKDFEKRLAECQ